MSIIPSVGPNGTNDTVCKVRKVVCYLHESVYYFHRTSLINISDIFA